MQFSRHRLRMMETQMADFKCKLLVLQLRVLKMKLATHLRKYDSVSVRVNYSTGIGSILDIM